MLHSACSLDDDMLDGDLGDGMGIQAAHRSGRMKSQSFSGVFETVPVGVDRPRCSLQAGETTLTPGLKSTETLQRARWKLQHSGSLDQLSKDQLRHSLQEASEVIDALCCELEVAHQYFEGKYKALKILQGKAILDRATCHTQSMLQKSEEKAKALEKEVNSLQWEISFNQVQMRKCQQSWEHNYSRVVSENRSLTDSLEERDSELQQLRAENAALSRQCLELLSMFNVKEQRAYQETKPKYSPDRDAGILELAVLGACRCAGVADVCPCSRAAAASRKQLIQLQQELDAQRSRREEALMVADAFRIAFEQQLRKRSENFLLLTEANILKSHHSKSEGANRSPLMSVSRRLRGLLPSGLEVKMSDDLLETLYRLLDLLNDKEEALAHQRKVSIMLAHSAEELQRQLLLDSHCQPGSRVPPESRVPSESGVSPECRVSPESRVPSESSNTTKQPGRTHRRSLSHHKSHRSKTQPSDESEFRTQSKPAQEPAGDQSQSSAPESKNQPEMSAMSNVQAQRMSELSEKLNSQLQPDQLSCLSESRSDPQGPAEPSQTTVQQIPNHKRLKSVIQPLDSPESRKPSKQSQELLKNVSQTDTPEPMTHVPAESSMQGQQNHLQVSHSQSGQRPSMSESRTEPLRMSHPPHTESRKPTNRPQGRLTNQSPMVRPESKTQVSSESNILGQLQLQCPVSHINVRPSCLLESRTEKQDQSGQKISQLFSNHKGHGSVLQQPNPPESRIPLHRSHQSKSDTPESKIQLVSTESYTLLQQNNKNHKSEILGPDPSLSRMPLKLGTLKIQSQFPPTLDTPESRTHSQATARSLRGQHTNTTTTRASRVSASAKATTKSVRVQD